MILASTDLRRPAAALLAGLLIALQPKPGSAANPQTQLAAMDVVAGNDITSSLLSYAMPTRPLYAGLSELRVTPAYVSYSLDHRTGGVGTSLGTADDAGGGVAASWTRAWSPHWGFSLFGSYAHLTGHQSVLEYDGCAAGSGCAVGSIPVKTNGAQAAATIIFDPFSKPDGFRLPIVLGLGAFYIQFRGSGANPAGQTSGPTDLGGPNTPRTTVTGSDSISVTVDQNKVFPGLFAGAAPQFNTWSLRWTPFLGFQTLGVYQRAGMTASDVSTGRSLGSGPFGTHDAANAFAGLTVQYLPWGLSFTYVFSQIYGNGETINMWNFSKAFSVGAAPPGS